MFMLHHKSDVLVQPKTNSYVINTRLTAISGTKLRESVSLLSTCIVSLFSLVSRGFLSLAWSVAFDEPLVTILMLLIKFTTLDLMLSGSLLEDPKDGSDC
jgi:hypothetical protein